MLLLGLRCSSCGEWHEWTIRYRCEACGNSLIVEYDYNRIFCEFSFENAGMDSGIWRFKPLFPVEPNVDPVTLGEGSTPLLRANRLESALSLANVFLKNETVNPTLSFKDRALSVALTVAGQFGAEAVVTASTGNTGVSAAAYAAKSGLPCTLFVPDSTPRAKLAAMERYGAILHQIDGTFSDAYLMAKDMAERNHWFNLTSTFLNPFAVEGHKTLAYELVEQLNGVPDWVIIPIGAGPLLVSVYRGFQELRLAGRIHTMPRLVGVQAAGCAPIARAFAQGKTEVNPWETPETVLSAIADPLSTYPADGSRTLKVIRESGGQVVGAPDEAVLKDQEWLTIQEGLYVENASAATLTALKILLKQGVVTESDSVVLVLTGHGTKETE